MVFFIKIDFNLVGLFFVEFFINWVVNILVNSKNVISGINKIFLFI